MGKMSLDRLCGGALLERFSLAMAQIGRNIMDPNTNPEKARTLTIKPVSYTHLCGSFNT